MIYNCYQKNGDFYVDLARSDEEVITKKFNFEMKLGMIPKKTNPADLKLAKELYTDLYTGGNLTTLQFSNAYKYREFKKEMDQDNRPIFGDIDPIYYCLAEKFPKPLKVFNPRFYTLDIEVYAKSEFPDPNRAEYVMNLITICDYQKKKYYTWGLKPFENETEFDVEYFYCKSELQLIEDLIQFILDNNIKCFTGWNTNGFDVPYIINRLKKFELRSEIVADFIKEHISTYGKNKSFVTIQVIDYLELYKKFKDKKLERYSLDFIATYEGFEGKKKLPWTLAETSDNHWDDYVVYNIIDNYKIVQLEDKLKYIKQAFSMANDNKCLPTDVYSPVKMWDAAVYFELYHRNILVPPRISESVQTLLGGYVGKPVCSVHKYLSVFDIASSYPHQIMQFNISPECLISDKKLPEELMEIRKRFTPTVAEMKLCTDPQFVDEWKSFCKELKKKQHKRPEEATDAELNLYRVKYNVFRFSQMTPEDFAEYTAILVKYNVTMTANLQFYRKDRLGIFPELMAKFFAIRNVAKKNSAVLKLHIGLIKEQLGIIEEEEKLKSFEDAEDELEEDEDELVDSVEVA